jgi:hypothetical protein
MKLKQTFGSKILKSNGTIRMAVLCLSAGILSTAAASAQNTTADILGSVTDVSGAVVPGAAIQIRNLGTGEVRTVQSQGTGDYVFTFLDPGAYSITITDAGFKTSSVKEVRIAAGDRSRVNFALEIGTTNETVEVTAATPALQTDSSTLTHAITAQSVQDLPLNGRNYINLVQIVPGANEGPANGLSSGARPDDRRQTSAISINGQSEIMNNQMIDGMDNNERIIGTIGVRPSVDAIQELRILTNSYSAESGRTGGGVINIITKQGANAIHGTAYEYFRNDHLNAYPFAFGTTIPKPKLRQHQTGGSISGPIHKDETFFFTDYERLYINQNVNPIQSIVPTAFEHNNPGNFSDIGGSVYTAAQLDQVGLDYFKLYPLPNSASATGTPLYTSTPARQQISNTYDARVDHNFNPSNLFFARYTYNGVTSNLGGRLPAVTIAGVSIAPGGDLGGLWPGEQHCSQCSIELRTHLHSKFPLGTEGRIHAYQQLFAAAQLWLKSKSGFRPTKREHQSVHDRARADQRGCSNRSRRRRPLYSPAGFGQYIPVPRKPDLYAWRTHHQNRT